MAQIQPLKQWHLIPNLNTDIPDPCLGRGGPESPVHFRNPKSDRAEQQGLGDGADSQGRQVRAEILGGKFI